MTQAETDLLHVAILSNSRTTAHAAQAWAHGLDPDQAQRTQQAQHHARELYLDRTFEGMLMITGRLEREAGEAVVTAINALTAPTAAGDLRTSPQRRAHALAEICHQHLNTGTAPEVESPQVVWRLVCPGQAAAWSGWSR